MKITDFHEYYQSQIRRQLETCDRNTGAVADVERAFVCKPLGTKENPRFVAPVCVTVRTTRRAEVDNRAVSEKAVVDGLVKAGILANDTKKQIKELFVPEPEIGQEEKTVITIETINEE